MTKETLDKIKMTKKWPFRLSDILSRFFFLIFPLFIILIGISEMNSGFKNNIPDLKITSFIITGVGFILMYFIAIRLYQNRRFDCFQINDLTADRLRRAIKDSDFKDFTYNKLGFFVCTTKISGFSWGEEITIIHDGDCLLINSRPTGSKFSYQPITIFKDKKNIRQIIERLKTPAPNTQYSQ
jgi:hypothetical protein